jgi:enoyl-CoA hydratase
MADAVTVEHRDEVAVISIDDGKANALSLDVLASINAGLDSLDASTRAVVLAGRTGMLSGGFDLAVMRGTDLAAIATLVTEGGDLVLRLYRSERPIIAACTGHAMAAGALLLLGAHFRVGADGPFKIGLIETAIGMVLPDWGVEAAVERLTSAELQQAAVESKVYDPVGACGAGFLDKVVPPDEVIGAAMAEAKRLGEFNPAAYAGNAAKVRGPGIERLAQALARDRADIAGLTADNADALG